MMNMDNYRPSEEEIPLNMEYIVTINGINQSGKLVTLGTNPDTFAPCIFDKPLPLPAKKGDVNIPVVLLNVKPVLKLGLYQKKHTQLILLNL